MKYKIDKYVIEANSPAEAVKAVKAIKDTTTKDYQPPFAIWVKDKGQWKMWGGTHSQHVDRDAYLAKGYEDVKVVKNGESPKDSVKDAFAIYNADKNKYLTYNGWGNKTDSDIQLFENEAYAEKIKNAYYNQAHIKVVRLHDNDLDYLTEEEEKAVDDYRQAINGTNNPKLLKLYQHILEEELEHIEELTSAEITEDACKTKDADSDVKQKALRFLELLKQSINSEMWQIVANDAYSLIDMLKRNKLAK